jgi:hypothetical protein
MFFKIKRKEEDDTVFRVKILRRKEGDNIVFRVKILRRKNY